MTLRVQRIPDPPEPEVPVCDVDYHIHGTRHSGFTTQIWLRNIGNEPIDGWVLEWEFPGNPRRGSTRAGA